MPRSIYRILFLALIVGNVVVYRTVFVPPTLQVHVLNVTKGSATLIETPSGRTLLIDTGPDAGILRALGTTLPMWQRHIDAVITTSPTQAASGGLPEVESRYKIGELIRSGVRGERLALGDGAFIDVLWPAQTPSALTGPNGTLVLRLSYGATSFVIQNDLPARVSDWLSTADAQLTTPNLAISSSTQPGTYISDGMTLIKN